MTDKQREELLELHRALSNEDEIESMEINIGEVVDDEPGAHKEHRRISRYGRSHHRFNQTMKGNK